MPITKWNYVALEERYNSLVTASTLCQKPQYTYEILLLSRTQILFLTSTSPFELMRSSTNNFLHHHWLIHEVIKTFFPYKRKITPFDWALSIQNEMISYSNKPKNHINANYINNHIINVHTHICHSVLMRDPRAHTDYKFNNNCVFNTFKTAWTILKHRIEVNFKHKTRIIFSFHNLSTIIQMPITKGN